jgi:hypothetical protein
LSWISMRPLSIKASFKRPKRKVPRGYFRFYRAERY